MFLNLWDFRKTKNKFVENILYFLPDKCRKKEIREYESFYIKVNTHIGVINVNGFNLNLIQMNQDDMKITGKIDSIEFENYEEDDMEEK